MRRKSGNESDARESSGNVAASKIIAGEITIPNMLRNAPNHPTTVGPASAESSNISRKGCDAITSEKAAIGAPCRNISSKRLHRGRFDCNIQPRSGNCADQQRRNATDASHQDHFRQPAAKAQGNKGRDSVIALPTIFANASISIRSLPRKEQASGPNSVPGISATTANTVNTNDLAAVSHSQRDGDCNA